MEIIGRPFGWSANSDVTLLAGDAARHDAIKNAIMMSRNEMLLTPFGGGIRQSLFEQRSDALQAQLEVNITDSINALVPNIVVNKVLVRASDDPEVEVSEGNDIFIVVSYRDKVSGDNVEYELRAPWTK